MIKFVSLYFLILLAGCASMKPNYKFCTETNWQDRGYADAKADKKMDETFQGYEFMCKGFDEATSKPNKTMYQHGHFTGVKDFCTFTSGHQFGYTQRVTSNNCDQQKHPEFYKGIEKGLSDYCSYENGQKAGLEGIIADKACTSKKHPQFYEGIALSLKTYCTFNHGVKMGSMGKEYTSVCKGKAEEEFLRGFQIGQNKSEINRLKEKVTSLQVENARLQERLNTLQEERDKLKSQNNELENQIQNLKLKSN